MPSFFRRKKSSDSTSTPEEAAPSTKPTTESSEHTEEVIAQNDNTTHEGRTITIALDVSQRSRDAFAWTVANLYRAGDKLSMVHVSPCPEVLVAGAGTPAVHAVSESDKREARKMLSNYAKYCLVNHITHEARLFVGDLGYIMGRLASKDGGSALVVGNHSKSSTEHFFLGSSSETAVHAAHVPVVVVKCPHKVSLNHDTKRRIGICVDSTENARGAFDWMMNELFRENDSVFVLHITGAGEDVTIVDGIEASSDTLMDKYAHLLQQTPAEYHTVSSRTHKALPEAAATLADSLSLDCLVVGCRGLGAVKRTLCGSFSDGLVRASKCNVIVVKH